MQNSSVTVQKCSTGAFFHCVRIPNVIRTKNKRHHPVDGVFYFGCRIGIRPPAGGAVAREKRPLDAFLTRALRIPFNRIEKQKHHLSVMLFFFGCRIGIRTPTNRVRVCRATVTQFGNVPRTHYSIASPGAFVKIFFKKIENFPSLFFRVAKKSKPPFTKVHKCGNIFSY